MPVTKEEKPKKMEKDVSSESGSEETGSTSGESVEGSSSGTGSTASSSSASSSSSVASGSKKGVAKQEIAVGRGPGGRVMERDKELDSLTIEMRSGKRLFVDAKENQRGKFIRVAEAFGRGNMGRSFGNRQGGGRIIMRLKVAKELAARLDEFTDAAEAMMETSEKREESKPEATETKPAAAAVGGRVRPVHSAAILDEGRRYFVDLLPSRLKGREPLLRLTMNNPVTGLRNTISVESGEAPYIKKALDYMVEKFYNEQEELEDKAEVELAHHSVKFGRRTFFFDPGRQARGKFVRVTEVCLRDGQTMRNSMMLPDKLLARFAKILNDYDGKINTAANDASSTGSGEGVKKEDGAHDKEEVKVDA